MAKNLNVEEVIPAEDKIQEELENVTGGADFNLCLSGCSTGEKKPKKDGGDGQTTEP
jgi:hypothetical protein